MDRRSIGTVWMVERTERAEVWKNDGQILRKKLEIKIFKDWRGNNVN